MPQSYEIKKGMKEILHIIQKIKSTEITRRMIIAYV